MLSARSFETGDEDGDQEIPGEDDDEDMEDGSASDDSDQMLDVERKARDIDRDRYMPDTLKCPDLCAGQKQA